MIITMKRLFCLLLFVNISFAETTYFDLQLSETGQSLHQAHFPPTLDGSASNFYILKYNFPAAASTENLGGASSSSLVSRDGRYRLYGTTGLIVGGLSESSRNFRLGLGFHASGQRSIYRIRKITEQKRPISTRY